jgi:hypothetical protein
VRLHVLRTPPARGADAVPQRIRRQPLFADAPVDLAAARLVRANSSSPAWIAPSSDGRAVCMIRAGAVACSPLEVLRDKGVAPAVNGRRGQPVSIAGIAVDGIRSVVLIEHDGTRTTVPVADNFFDVQTDAWPRALTWIGPAGSELLELAPYDPALDAPVP